MLLALIARFILRLEVQVKGPLERLLDKTLRAPSFGGGCVIQITFPINKFLSQVQQKRPKKESKHETEKQLLLQGFTYFGHNILS